MLDNFILMHPLWGFRNIRLHCVSGVLVLSRYAIAKYVLQCLDKQWYDCFSIHLISCNIPPVFPIIKWYFIRDYNLFYIACYLLLLMKVFRYNIYLTTFIIRHLYYLFLNPSYFFKWVYQIAKNNYLVLCAFSPWSSFHNFSVSFSSYLAFFYIHYAT